VAVSVYVKQFFGLCLMAFNLDGNLLVATVPLTDQFHFLLIQGILWHCPKDFYLY